jgi:hypothetical protein
MSAMTEPAAPPPSSAPPPPSAPWQPPKPSPQRDPTVATIAVGLVFLVIGIWYFLDTTLGLTMPDIEWGDLWPILLIAIGGVILYRAAVDRRR